LVGIALLFLGRKAFWLFVGGVGFLLGIRVATQLIQSPHRWLVLAIALIVGLIGAFLATILQHVAVGLAGFVAGGYVAWSVAAMFGWEMGVRALGVWEPWLIFVAGGVLFAVLIGLLFEWALIFVSSVTGATLITQSSVIREIRPGVQTLLFAVLVGAGIVLQAIMYQAERSRRPEAGARRSESTWR
jgi:hypothetical protein